MKRETAQCRMAGRGIWSPSLLGLGSGGEECWVSWSGLERETAHCEDTHTHLEDAPQCHPFLNKWVWSSEVLQPGLKSSGRLPADSSGACPKSPKSLPDQQVLRVTTQAKVSTRLLDSEKA